METHDRDDYTPDQVIEVVDFWCAVKAHERFPDTLSHSPVDLRRRKEFAARFGTEVTDGHSGLIPFISAATMTSCSSRWKTSLKSGAEEVWNIFNTVLVKSRRLYSRVDLWRHRGGMSCACPGRLEMSRGSVEAKYVTS